MKVSVVVPLYNKERHVRRALDSIAVQTFGEFEAIVVDDGSRDRGPEIVEAFQDSRFRLIRQTNAGPAAARNRGIAEARGELLAFLDADDAWRPRYLEKAVEAFRSPQPTVQAFTASYAEFPDRNLEHVWRRRRLQAGLQRIDQSVSPLRFHYMVAFMTPCSTVARTETVRAYGGFQEGFHYGEDAILWLRVLLNDPVWFDMETLVDVDRGASGLSGNLGGPRPIEPFVAEPELVFAHCPPEHRDLLRRFVALRAAKTAAMYGYWGRTNEARQVFNSHREWHDRGHWYTWAGYAATTPVAALAGSAWRGIRQFSRASP